MTKTTFRKVRYFILFIFLPFISVSQTQIGNTITGVESAERFGRCISLSADGKIMAVSAPFNDVGGVNSGQVRVYSYINNTWSLLGTLLMGF